MRSKTAFERSESRAGKKALIQVLSERIHIFTANLANLANGHLFPWSRPASDGFAPEINGGGPPSPGGLLSPWNRSQKTNGHLFPWSRPASDGFAPEINGGGPPSLGSHLSPFSTTDHAVENLV